MSAQKVLVVDDTESNIDILVDTLGDDYDVIVAMDGPAALESAAMEKPDLILLDILMPEMDGYEVCRRLKESKATRDIPVIFVTVKGEVADEIEGLKLGAVDYITKPFSPPIIKARVATHLLLKKQHDQLNESISLLKHEAEILQQKADVGIQAGCLAHDINNILCSLMGYASIIDELVPENVPEQSEIKESISVIKEQTALVHEICRGYTSYLNDIGAEARVQAIAPLLQPLDMYARRVRGNLKRDIASDSMSVQCKGYQLKRVFLNLFVNACQATANNEVEEISLRLFRENGRVIFSITDNGAGIPPQITPKIFDECFTSKPEGTGLGLFLVKQIVDEHQGTIEVNSDEGRGATFTLSFPAVEEAEPGLNN